MPISGSGTASHRARSHLLPTQQSPGCVQRPPEHPLGSSPDGAAACALVVFTTKTSCFWPKPGGEGSSGGCSPQVSQLQLLPAALCLPVVRVAVPVPGNWKCAFLQPDFLCGISCSASSALNADVSHGMSAAVNAQQEYTWPAWITS